jgi:hypothetical protein
MDPGGQEPWLKDKQAVWQRRGPGRNLRKHAGEAGREIGLAVLGARRAPPGDVPLVMAVVEVGRHGVEFGPGPPARHDTQAIS